MFVLQATQMQQLCVQANCTFWVDMELFRADMSNGLLPKDFPGVAQELVRVCKQQAINKVTVFAALRVHMISVVLAECL